MLLVQISDVHCGPMLHRGQPRAAIREINALSPDVLLVTGDMTEDGLVSEFGTARKELKPLKAEKIIYIGGNHDY